MGFILTYGMLVYASWLVERVTNLASESGRACGTMGACLAYGSSTKDACDVVRRGAAFGTDSHLGGGLKDGSCLKPEGGCWNDTCDVEGGICSFFEATEKGAPFRSG